MATVHEIDPISRIEGHLGVKVYDNNDNGFIDEADMHGNLWRGFENFLLGRAVNDAITFTQRICGVCPVPHGQTSTYAIDAALGYSRSHITFAYDGSMGVPKKAVLIRNLVLSAEFLMSHLTHFYHLVVLDYVQGPATPPWTPWFNDTFYDVALRNPGGNTILPSLGTDASGNGAFSDSTWSAGVTQYVKALRMRRLTFEAGALFAGRMPMTSCFVGGGVTNNGQENLADATFNRIAKYKTIMEEVGQFIIKEHVPLVLALSALYQAYDNSGNGAGANYGAGWGNFVAWGAFPDADDDSLALPGGVKVTNAGVGGTAGIDFQVLNKTDVYNKFLGDDGSGNSIPENLTEDIAEAHYAISTFDTDNYTGTSAYPGVVQRTEPDRAAGYSYIKSPRWAGNPCEVGPFARMVVAGFYPIDQTALIGTMDASFNFTGAMSSANIGVAGYDAYAKIRIDSSGNPVVGLDPRMIAADLAVGVLRDGLATLTLLDASGNKTVVDAAFVGDPSGNSLSKATLVAAYANVGAYAAYDTIITGVVAGWVAGLKGGLSTFDRIRGRALEALYLVQKMIGTYTTAGGAWDANAGVYNGVFGSDGWINNAALLTTAAGSSWRSKPAPTAGVSGKWGATEAPRGALAHFVSTNAQGKITAYQCVVPTTWNANPKDSNGNNGPIEKAIIGAPYDQSLTKSFTSKDGSGNITAMGGLEALRITHTFDPCIACAVH